MIHTFADRRSEDRRRPRVGRSAKVAAVSMLPLFALAFASLESAVVYAAGQLLKTIGAAQ